MAVRDCKHNNGRVHGRNRQDNLRTRGLFGRTASSQWPVGAEDVGPDSPAPEQLRPVHGVVVAQLGVLADVDAAVADLPEGAQAQRGEGGDAHHHQGEAPSESTGGHVSAARRAPV